MATHGSTEPPRREIDLPAPWSIGHHTLRALEPDTLQPDDPVWGWFTEDLLQATHPARIRIDVGWRPDGDPRGSFQLRVIHDDRWDAPSHALETRSLARLLEAIERLAKALDAAAPPPEPLPDRLVQIRDTELPREAAALVRGLEATDALISLISDPRPLVRFAAVEALARRGDPTAGAALFDRFNLPEPDLETRRSLIRALGAVGHAPAAPVLARWLTNPDAEQRIAAARSLARLEAVALLPQVQEAYATERSGRVRPHLREALSALAKARARQRSG